MKHLESVANNENVTSRTINNYLQMLYSQARFPKVCKEILSMDTFPPVSPQISCDKAAYLLDSLEIGRSVAYAI